MTARPTLARTIQIHPTASVTVEDADLANLGVSGVCKIRQLAITTQQPGGASSFARECDGVISSATIKEGSHQGRDRYGVRPSYGKRAVHRESLLKNRP